MGLDMYLETEVYICGWEHAKPADRGNYTAILAATGLMDLASKHSPFLTVTATVAYWRKANAIHRWFVENCQGGRDECQRTHVDRHKLQELVDLCKRVLESVETVEGLVSTGTSYSPDKGVEHHTREGRVVAQSGLAAAMLPTQSGFLFGTTDYDEYYLADLKDTIQQLEPLLKSEAAKDLDFYYRASW